LIFPDVNCARNEHALILGPSGSGKTTLLHLLGGILKPSAGEIHIGEIAVHQLSGHQLDQFRGKHIGLIFQRPHFLKSLSAIENLLLSQKLSGNKTDKKEAQHLLERLGISHKGNNKAHQLSIGEQQRLAIARALVNKPDIILADEPSSALDDHNCHVMISMLREVAEENNANLIVVTHDGRIKDEFVHKIYLASS
jgi:putative ABC transport system ATP-binding protein